VRLYTFDTNGETRFGLEKDRRLVDLAAAAAAANIDGAQLGNLMALLQGGEEALAAARRVEELDMEKLKTDTDQPLTYAFDTVRLRQPLLQPGKILCSGINYKGHLEENPGAILPRLPFFFSKLPSAVVGPGDPIVAPAGVKQLDYEVEFAAIIGKTAHHVSEDAIMDHVAGYTILHDVSARDIQFEDSQITLGKNYDSFAPMGPCMVTRDELPDLSDVRLRAYVNEKLLQDGSTSDWFYPLPQLLSFLCSVMTLEPGDVVSTGTPAGVGYFRDPQIYLHPGDTVRLEIEGIGQLENPVVAQ